MNAVAEGDCMPLTLAEELEASTSDKETIIDVLLKRYVVCGRMILSEALLNA